MKRNPYNLVFLIGLVIGSLGLLVGLARAQSPDCSGAALVQVQPGFTLNVRALPGGLSPILDTVTEKSGQMRVVEERGGFLRLETGGWIVNKYLSISCWGLGTPVAVTAVPSPTAARAPLPTPTQIQHNFIWCSSEPEIRRIGQSWVVECER